MNLTEQADLALASDPQFGASTVIEAKNIARYRLGLAVLAGRRVPDAAPLFKQLAEMDDAGLRPMMYDPVLRNAFEDDVAALENGVAEPGALAHYLALGLDVSADGQGPCERLTTPAVRLSPGQGIAWVWTELRPSSPAEQAVADRLEELFAGSFADARDAGRVVPDEGMLAALHRGRALLADLLPNAAAGIFPHISLVGFARGEMADGPFNSLAGGDPLPSAVLMTPERLGDPWMTAEILLHEGLHLKLFDVLRTCSLVRDPDQLVPIPWRITSWTLTRVLFALHVYVHMVLFRAAATDASAELRGRYGEPPATEVVDAPTEGSEAAETGDFLTSLQRARYLGQQAAETHRERLTAEGRRFVDWLLAALDTLTPRPESASEPTVAAGTEEPGDAADAALLEPARHPMADEPVPAVSGYRKAEPVSVCPIPEHRQLLAFSPDPPRFRWLNEHAWFIYALCDGGDIDSIRSRYRATTGDVTDERLETGLAALVSAGLIVPA
ncbi:aKG-HExxH-type peptide beta-hydroxylase [Microtetraspora fusca]|uniref:aKG-HExxH-type peptide beta-hydroxylase n=1 Tax=Microtetraspora fusca TaxID=1997 RepID=UPI00082BAFB1|nr:HEXXH motif-containing putative peptide modification protein [Microtetraspora fusca]